MYFLILLLLSTWVSWYVFKKAKRAWDRADIIDLKTQVKTTSELHGEAEEINLEELQEKRKLVIDIINLKE